LIKEEDGGVERMYHTTFKALILFAAVTAFIVTPASATILGTVNIDNHTNNLSEQGTLYGDGYPNGIYAFTGVYSWTNEDSGTGLGPYVPNWGFCIEMPQSPNSGFVNVIPLEEGPVDDTPIMGITKANYIRELWGRDFDPSWITGQNRQMAEAFSVAIMEIIYETDPRPWDVTSGAGFHVGADVEQAATANTWLSQLDGSSAYFANNLVAISTDLGQDYIVQIPEPATLSLLAVGAAALLRRRRS
jgi:hypothetical protein